jgi:hypothetical protein
MIDHTDPQVLRVRDFDRRAHQDRLAARRIFPGQRARQRRHVVGLRRPLRGEGPLRRLRQLRQEVASRGRHRRFPGHPGANVIKLFSS